MSFHKFATPSIFALLLFGGATSPGGSNFVAETSPIAPTAWNRPIAFTLEARSVEKTAAFGMHVVHPIFHSGPTAVLVEGYGYEGEGALAVVGGGVVFRRLVGRQGFAEASFFFDGLRATDGFSYPQLGAGLAVSPSSWLTLRTNGYLPLRGKDSREGGVDRWSEIEGSGDDRREVDYRRIWRTERSPMRGYDVEAEFRLPHPPRYVDPRLAVGYSYREADDRPEVYSGMTVRGELHFAKHWAAEAEWRNDAHDIDQEWRVGVRFEMLLGPGASSVEDARSGERYLPVERFPWPTVARGASEKKEKEERVRTRDLAPDRTTSDEPTDCCVSGHDPLIFD